jgi:hypothetical protein
MTTTMPDQDIPGRTPRCSTGSRAPPWRRISELVHAIPGGTEEEQRALATAVAGEILARTPAIPDAAFVAEITNAVLATHKRARRLVAVS